MIPNRKRTQSKTCVGMRHIGWNLEDAEHKPPRVFFSQWSRTGLPPNFSSVILWLLMGNGVYQGSSETQCPFSFKIGVNYVGSFCLLHTRGSKTPTKKTDAPHKPHFLGTVLRLVRNLLKFTFPDAGQGPVWSAGHCNDGNPAVLTLAGENEAIRMNEARRSIGFLTPRLWSCLCSHSLYLFLI